MICASASTACAQKARELTICVLDLRLRHFSKAASMPRSTASSGTPAFFQVSISAQSSGESRKQPGAAGALEVLLDLGEVVEVVEDQIFVHARRFRSQMSRRPSSVRFSSICFR